MSSHPVHESFTVGRENKVDSLPQCIKLSSSFAAFKIRITSFTMARIAIFGTGKSQIHPLPHYAVFRLGHSPLNINMKSFRQCTCGSTETLEHLLQCNLTLHHRNLLLTLKNTFFNEKMCNQPQYSTITNKTLIHILLFGHPKLSFKPTVVIFSALSRFLKNSRRFKSLT